MGLERLIFLGVLVVAHCIAVPLDGADDSVCTFKNVTYAKGQEVLDMAPCEICRCESPPEIKCSMIKCQQNNGCKIIQQTNRCCPEYKCECEHEGKTYNNGEKLENPLDPCQVCYCRGGEIMCTSVTCYYREDCEPQYITGQCCPKYGHCPPVEAKSVQKLSNASSANHREMQPWLLTKPGSLPTTATEDLGSRPRAPQTIKIVEILPTPQQPGEVSMVPRIITADSHEHQTPALPAAPVTEASLRNTSVDEQTMPDSEYFTTVLPTNAEYNEFNETEYVEDATEGSGYDMMSGGTYIGFEVFEHNATSTTEDSLTDSTTEGGINTTHSAFVNSRLSVPPVVKLNHHLQYLKVASHDNVTENDTSPIVRIDIHSPPSSQLGDDASSNGPQVILRPEDLKKMAEILINQTIKPAEIGGRSKNLTNQEIWAQKVIDRLGTNVLLPLQGIELYDNDTNTTTVEPLEMMNTTEHEMNDEPTSVSDDSSEEVSDEEVEGEEGESQKAVTSAESSEEEDDLKEKSSEETSSPKETIPRDPTASRRVRVSDKKSSGAMPPTPFDEHDRFIVENFFKKTLKVN